MSLRSDQFDDQSPPPEMARELNALIGRVCDGAITVDELRRLNQLLDEDQTARRLYLRYIAVHSALVTTAGRRFRPAPARNIPLPQLAAFDDFRRSPLPNGTSACDPPTNGRVASDPRPLPLPWRVPRRRLAAAAAAIVCMVGALWMLRTELGSDDTTVWPVARRDRSPVAVEEALQPVAKITYVSPGALWVNPNESYALAARVRAGQRIALVHGVIELTYASGTTLLLTGPSDFLVHAAGGTLGRGEVMARVTKEGHGFTIETPHGKVIDLGTEFGVVVDDFGVSEVRVFEGKVEAFPAAGAAGPTEKFELTTGRALQWNSRSIIPVNVGGRRFGRPGAPGFDASEVAETNSGDVIADDDFRSGDLNATAWQTLGGVRPSAAGLQLRGEPGGAQQPYLITREQFDPSDGPLTITCEVEFSDLEEAAHPSFSILTRSADQRGDAGTPWEDLLARCVRCSLKADAQTGDGMLEAGTKYEGNRELSNISWRGFVRPEPLTPYRLEMRDDGLNVAFTVSLADNPSIRKTVTCRSLFRGNLNFIALEGFAGGTATVKNVRIVQDRRPSAVDGRLALESSARQPAPPDASEVARRLLAELVPAQATLVVKDDFDRVELRPQWTTLGNVAMHQGQLRLGAPNDEQHIDTWTPRPYLLTAERFSPAARALTIIGTATFDPNYLHGYGGSFAVMTRAEAAYGAGYGWEKSILRRGVRSNFWPAALGHNHSMEIFEKAEADSISLLAADGFHINPESRSYVFRVVDDGRSASLTLIDAANPDVRQTISHPTASHSLTEGHIAFEGCWGSPVLVDGIRIFETRDTPRREAEPFADPAPAP